MQAVSNEYKAAMSQPFRNRSYVQIVLDIVDLKAAADAALSDNGHAPFSDVMKANGVMRPARLYATMENNRFPVDGGQFVVPDNGVYSPQGYCSDAVSLADGTFAQNPAVSISFSELHRIIGFTITFDTIGGLYCTDFTVKVFNGNTLVKTYTVTGNTDIQHAFEAHLDDFDRLQIEFVKTSQPFNRVHVYGFLLGLVKTFGNDQLMDDGMTQDTGIDPISSALPTAQLDFSIDNYDGKYNPDNPEGIYRYLQQQQPVVLSYGHDVGGGVIEWIPGGRYYLTGWSAPANKQTASFTAHSLLESMQEDYKKGVYAPAGATLYDLACAVLTDAGLPQGADAKNPWQLDDSLKDIKTTAPLPVKPRRELLQLIANAGMCVLFPDRAGVLHIEPISTVQTDYFLGLDTASQYPENTLSTPVREVDVKVYSYAPETASSDIYTGTVAASGTQTIHIDYADSPAANLSATVTGGTLVSADYYAYSCDLTIMGTGSVTIKLTGNKLNAINSIAACGKNSTGEICPVDNPLITDPTNALNVAQWVAEYLDKRRTYEVSYRGEPALDTGDLMNIQTQFTDSMPARVLESKIAFSTSLSGTLTLKGVG